MQGEGDDSTLLPKTSFSQGPFALGITKFKTGCSIGLPPRNRPMMMQDDICIAIPMLTGS